MNDLAVSAPESDVNITDLDDSWRRWIAENLMLGVSPECLVPTLVQQGIGEPQAIAEVTRAASSPYLQGSQRILNRLKKRDWLLESYSRLHRLLPLRHLVDVRPKLSRDDFLRDYYSANRPVVITGMMDDWPALRMWTPTRLRERFGDREVEIQFGRTQNQRYEYDGPRKLDQEIR